MNKPAINSGAEFLIRKDSPVLFTLHRSNDIYLIEYVFVWVSNRTRWEMAGTLFVILAFQSDEIHRCPNETKKNSSSDTGPMEATD